MGVIFAPSHAVAASELARVIRPGGRLGFTAWRSETAFFGLARRYAPPPPEGAGDSDDWGREEYVRMLLGDQFELTLEPRTMAFEAESGDALWELMARAIGPFKAASKTLGPDVLAEYRREFVTLLDSHREAGGGRLPGEYLLVLGTRR
jgi:hypothetical protein